jgi:hypothetical protein
MSTRGIFCAVKGGEYKVAIYNHSDSYPSWLGSKLLNKFRDEETREDFSFAISSVEAGDDEDQSSSALEIIDEILRGERDKINDQLSFAGDSLFCEWGYVLDYDRQMFEIYEGFQKGSSKRGDRFYFLDSGGEYKPIKMIDCFHFSRLPKCLPDYEKNSLDTF